MRGQRLLVAVLVGLVAAFVLGRTAAIPVEAQGSVERVIGDVTAANPATKQIGLKLDAGGAITVVLQDKTVYLRVPPGETDLKKAVTITPADIGVGDRVYARGRMAEDQTSIDALSVIVMTKADLARTREQERAALLKRTIAGTVSALNPEAQEITLSVRAKEGTTTLIIQSSEKSVFRRYAADTVRLAQATPSSFADLRVGDAVRVLGDKNPKGTHVKPEEIISGSFRNIAGLVTAIDVAGGEVRITDLQSRRPLTVRITSETMVRRMPPAKPATAKPAPSAAPAQPATTGGLADLDRMPVVKFSDLKRDEAVVVLCTVGAEPSRVTAMVVVAGVESLLGPALQDQTQVVGAWNFFDVSVP